MSIKISPSILSADLAKLPEQVEEVARAGADRLHIDVMDGHFVPNLTFGPAFVKCLKRVTTLWQEVHLMVTHPEKFIQPFAEAGAKLIMVHAEVEEPTSKLIEQIRKAGCKVGLVIKPKTGVAEVQKYLKQIDLLLIMTVEPGFGGQPFMLDMLLKIREARDLLSRENPDCELEVDGGVDAKTAPLTISAGANVLVAGNSIFGGKKPIIEAMKDLKQSFRNCS